MIMYSTNISSKKVHPLPVLSLEKHCCFDKFLQDKLVISTHTYIYFIDINNIIYLQSEGNYCKVVTSDEQTILASKTLKHFENLLANRGFVRVHASYLINLFKVKGIKKNGTCSIVLEQGAEIPISQKNRTEIVAKFRI